MYNEGKFCHILWTHFIIADTRSAITGSSSVSCHAQTQYDRLWSSRCESFDKVNAPQLNSPRRFWAITATAYITKFYFLIQTLWTCKKFPVYTTPKELWLPTLNVNISIALCSKNPSSITAWGDRKAIILVDNSCLFEGIK